MLRLRDFKAGEFLRDTWQRKPLLMRRAWEGWSNPLSPDELAGLACEAGVESRLVVQHGGEWQLEHGPLPERCFRELGGDPWTLLVQAVDHHVPEVAELLEPFRFIPNWRIDDVMVSYATDQGGVGPHFDNYDVFLVQGLGRRRWQVGGRCTPDSQLLAHDGLRLLADFEPVEEWVLEPGDILYVPPGVAHNGIAVGDDCMTYSIGFRAPSSAELTEGWAENVAAELAEDDRYADPGLAVQENPGEIVPEALSRLHALATRRLLDEAEFAQWFGRHSTAPKNPEIDWRPGQLAALEQVRGEIDAGSPLLRNPASRFAFTGSDGDAVTLFVDGRGYACAGLAAAFARQLCAEPEMVVAHPVDDTVVALVAELVNEGAVAFD